jgi:hypothetical protein
VVLSFFRRFLRETTTFGSEIGAKSGGSEMYERLLEAVEKPPKPECAGLWKPLLLAVRCGILPRELIVS